MVDSTAVILTHRGVIKVAGADRRGFLQGIVSNDVERVTPERAVWAAFLTPQGKFLHEFFVTEQGDSLLLDCEAARAGDLLRSEEHTSELQSLMRSSYAVFCLKKKKQTHKHPQT